MVAEGLGRIVLAEYVAEVGSACQNEVRRLEIFKYGWHDAGDSVHSVHVEVGHVYDYGVAFGRILNDVVYPVVTARIDGIISSEHNYVVGVDSWPHHSETFLGIASIAHRRLFAGALEYELYGCGAFRITVDGADFDSV